MPNILARTEDGLNWITTTYEDLSTIPSFSYLPSPQDSLTYEMKAYIREVCADEVKKWLTEHCSTTLQL